MDDSLANSGIRERSRKMRGGHNGISWYNGGILGYVTHCNPIHQFEASPNRENDDIPLGLSLFYIGTKPLTAEVCGLVGLHRFYVFARDDDFDVFS